MTATIAVQGLTKRYGNIEAVRDVGFDLEPGEIVALVGHNGAGKTTLLKLLLGLVHPTEGSMRVLGEDPAAGQFEARRRLGYLPENVSFNPALTARELISFYARLKGQAISEALELLERVGLGSASSRRLGTYSKGMRQRLGLAQALIGSPGVLLLDEPTTGLDPALRLDFYDIVEARRAAGATVVLSSHALAELGDRAGRIIIMNRERWSPTAPSTICAILRAFPPKSAARPQMATPKSFPINSQRRQSVGASTDTRSKSTPCPSASSNFSISSRTYL